jgi:hypothetical protein
MGAARSTSGTREVDTGRGVLQGHAYGVLEAVVYKGVRLIRCRNPWGRTEWTGPWSDTDTAKWDAQTRKDLKHSLGDDGTFWISFEDFIIEFNKMYLCRLISDTEYRKVSFHGKWRGKSAGGCANYPTWVNNPQYRLTVPKACEVIISVQQQDPRITGTETACIGFNIFAAPAAGTRTGNVGIALMLDGYFPFALPLI